MGWSPAQEASGTAWMVPLLSQLLIDPYDAVRSRAAIALQTIPGFEDLDYDFLAAEKDRSQAKANVMQRWKGRKNLRKSTKQEPLLLQSSGGLDQQNFDRLLRWRDDRNVFLSE